LQLFYVVEQDFLTPHFPTDLHAVELFEFMLNDPYLSQHSGVVLNHCKNFRILKQPLVYHFLSSFLREIFDRDNENIQVITSLFSAFQDLGYTGTVSKLRTDTVFEGLTVSIVLMFFPTPLNTATSFILEVGLVNGLPGCFVGLINFCKHVESVHD
jgi:hypothetical protein